MTTTKGYLFIVFLSLFNGLQAIETIRGKVIDQNNNPVDAVAVILQTTDSVFIDATITDIEGLFSFEVEKAGYRLFFQHILYENHTIEVSEEEIGTILLHEKDFALDEITVTAERPQVKVDGGTLIYDTPQLIKNKPVTNAFEAIKELPGISGDDETIQLLGASSLNIVINGQLTTLSLPQLISMLKSMPASRVIKTEIMYNAPARYNVKGALINVVIEQDIEDGEMLQGEAGAEYQQRHYARGLAHANVLYSSPRWNADVLINGTKGRNVGGEDMFARHTFPTEIIEIQQRNRGKSDSQTGSFRLGLDYSFPNQDKISAAYYLNADKTDAQRSSDSDFNYLDKQETVTNISHTTVDGNSALHNLNIQYAGHTNTKAGVDYTRFRSPDHQHYRNHIEGELMTDMLNDSKQDINKWMTFINQSHTIAQEWEINYGMNVSYTNSKTRADYRYLENGQYIPDEDSYLDNTQKEYGGNLFGEVSKTFGNFSATIALKAEYFRSDYLSNGEKTILWDDWAFFPTASLSYTFSPFHILQFNLSSEKNYPSYWSINPQTTYLNAYSVIQGNPSLKPSREYEAQLLYILKQKYIFMAFCQYEPDEFSQLPYQSRDELQTVFRFENFDFSLITGIGAIIPVTFFNRIQSRLTLQGMRFQQKSDDFYDTPFNNKRLVGRVGLDNTITLSEAKPNLKLTVNGYYVSPAIQGIYKLGDQYDVSSGLKWIFAKDKAELTFKYQNIFRSRMPSPIVVDMGSQYSRMKGIDSSRYFGVAFVWKFGGFKEKNYEKPDNSRFGR